MRRDSMKKLLALVGAISLLAALAAAQTPEQSLARQIRLEKTAVMGKAVKGAPYSGDEVTESAQVLGDGTHINRSSQVSVYRDGEGRVRRETAKEITIWDPVAEASYTLDPATRTARKSPMGKFVLSYATASGPVVSSPMLVNGTPTNAFVQLRVTNTNDAAVTLNSEPVDPKLAPAALAKLQDEMKAADGGAMTIDGGTASPATLA